MSVRPEDALDGLRWRGFAGSLANHPQPFSLWCCGCPRPLRRWASRIEALVSPQPVQARGQRQDRRRASSRVPACQGTLSRSGRSRRVSAVQRKRLLRSGCGRRSFMPECQRRSPIGKCRVVIAMGARPSFRQSRASCDSCMLVWWRAAPRGYGRIGGRILADRAKDPSLERLLAEGRQRRRAPQPRRPLADEGVCRRSVAGSCGLC